MKKTYKIVIVIYFLLLNLITFAQIVSGPGDESNNGSSNLEGVDPQASPINSQLWILVIMGLLYSFFLMNRNHQIKKLN